MKLKSGHLGDREKVGSLDIPLKRHKFGVTNTIKPSRRYLWVMGRGGRTTGRFNYGFPKLLVILFFYLGVYVLFTFSFVMVL